LYVLCLYITVFLSNFFYLLVEHSILLPNNTSRSGIMKFNTIFMIIASATAANAHSTVTNVLVNGVDQGPGNSAAGYIRSPPNNNPVKDITSKDMACNVNNVATTKTLSVAGGDTVRLTISFRKPDFNNQIDRSPSNGTITTHLLQMT
jgi:cellulase